MEYILPVFFAVGGGVLPALLWLWFWLKEDSDHPEPRRLVLTAFIAGAISILPVLYVETQIYNFVNGETIRYVIWSAIEEIFKFIFLYIFVLRSKFVDEPIDFGLYLVTGALGFAAVENALFMWPSLLDGSHALTVLAGNLRFIGATLLHVAASGIIGICMGLAFYKPKSKRILYTALGLILAIALHATFNLSIIMGEGNNSLSATTGVWFMIILLLLAFEKIRRVHPENN
jgi:RsiW-degrading membrane proteinase PrsW (M82 family)